MASRAILVPVAIGAIAVVIALVLASLYLNPTKPATSTRQALANPYVNRGFGFSIKYPDGWTGQEFRRLDANTTTLVSFNDSKSDIDIVASKTNPGDTLDSLDAKSKTLALSHDSTHSKTVESEGSGTAGGQDVKVRTWIIQTSAGPYKQVVYHTIHRGYLLSISFISPQSDFNSEIAQFNNSLKTLSLF